MRARNHYRDRNSKPALEPAAHATHRRTCTQALQSLYRSSVSGQKTLNQRPQPSPATKYRYLSYFFGIAITLTICVSAKKPPLIPPEISGFAYPQVRGKQERYVSTAGRPARKGKGHHPRAVGTGDQTPEGGAPPSRLRSGEVGIPLG